MIGAVATILLAIVGLATSGKPALRYCNG